MHMRVIPELATTALRTAIPALDRTAQSVWRRVSGGGPRPTRSLIYATAVLAVVAVAAILAWSAFWRPVTVATARVAAGVPEQVFGLGTVGARVQSNVGFKVAGVLAELRADQGDHVQAGQVLARLNARDVEAQLAQAKAGVAQAHANIDKARADVLSADANLANATAMSKRRAALVEKGFTSQEEAQSNEAARRVAAANLAGAQSGIGVAEAARQAAEAQEAFAEATLTNYTLHAPYDAWVVSRNLELGSMPNPGQPVFTLVAAPTIWVLAYVDERLAGRLRVGQPAEIVLRSDHTVRLPGHVARIEIQSDAVNEERLVNVAFDRVPEDIHLAEQAEVIITTGTLPRATLIQPIAVSDLQDARGTVWTVEDGRLERRLVTFGRQLLDGRLPIVDGVPENAAVVAAPVSGLRVGRTARIGDDVPP